MKFDVWPGFWSRNQNWKFASAYGECLTALARYEQAEELLVESYHTVLEQLGARHGRALDTHARLVAEFPAGVRIYEL